MSDISLSTNSSGGSCSRVSVNGGLFSVRGRVGRSAVAKVNGQRGFFSHYNADLQISYFRMPRQVAIYIPNNITQLHLFSRS